MVKGYMRGNSMKFVRFIDKATRSITLSRLYFTDDEYFEIMDNIDPEIWEVIFYEVKQ